MRPQHPGRNGFAREVDAILDGAPARDTTQGRGAAAGQGGRRHEAGDAAEPPGSPSSPHGGPKKPRWPAPVPITELTGAGASVEWIWEGCIARGHVTLLPALMKSGKSTLVGHLFRSLQEGKPFAGLPTQRSRTLVVSEESDAIWARRRDTLGLDASLSLLCRPMMGKPTLAAWAEFLVHVRDCAVDGQCDLAVIDTLAAFAPWENENNSAEIQAALTPLNELTKVGLGVVLIHHMGKTDGTHGRAARGSTALAAGVDIILEMRRYKDERGDRHRVLSGMGRFDEVPDELVIALAEDGSGYRVEGDRAGVAAQELAPKILEILPLVPPGMKAEDVHAVLPEGGRPSLAEVRAALAAGAQRGAWQVTGQGVRGKPRRYWNADS